MIGKALIAGICFQMLGLSQNTSCNIRKSCTTSLCVDGPKTGKIALFSLDGTTVLKPTSFMHCLGKNNFRSNTFRDGLFIDYLAEGFNVRCALSVINA